MHVVIEKEFVMEMLVWMAVTTLFCLVMSVENKTEMMYFLNMNLWRPNGKTQ